MANLYENTIEAVQHMPTEWDQPLIAGAAALVVVGAGLAAKHYHNHTPEKGAVDGRGIAQALEDSKIGTDKDSNKRRFSPVTQMSLGAGLLAIQLIGQPGYEATFPDAQAEVVVVIDASSSMLLTKDLGQANVSRHKAVLDATKSAEFPGSLGFVETAANSVIRSKQTKDWRVQANSLDLPVVDPNGGQLIPALEQANSLFIEDAKTKKRSGTIIVMSDGTLNESGEALSAEAAKLKKSGVNVEVITPGTSKGTYVLPESNQETKSGAKPEALSAFDAKIANPQTVAEINTVINETIKSAGTRREREDWPIPGILGGTILALATGRLLTRTITKKY